MSKAVEIRFENIRGGILPAVAALLVALMPSVASGDSGAAGDQFQVNTYTTGWQLRTRVATDAGGGFVVVWQSPGSAGTDTSGDSIQAQRYASDGSPLGGQFQVNTYTTSFQGPPSVAAGAGGDFVVVWGSLGSVGTDTSGGSVQGQRYASDGSRVGGQFQVNTYTTDSQSGARVAAGAGGDFVVVWRSDGSFGTDTWGESVQGQRFASDGSPLGGEFQVNTYTRSLQGLPVAAMDAGGDFVVAWWAVSSGIPDNDFSIQAQLFAADGSPVGGEFQVNSYTTGGQQRPSVAMDGDGDFVVVWDSSDGDGSDLSFEVIEAQRYASDGSPLGDQFQVNTYTTSRQYFADVSLAAGGDFVVVWRSYGSPGNDNLGRSVQGQRYAADGSEVGEQFQVNTYTPDNQRDPSVAMDADGDFVVVWESYGSPGTDTNYSIQGRRYQALVFADGFESGDTSVWSSTVP